MSRFAECANGEVWQKIYAIRNNTLTLVAWDCIIELFRGSLIDLDSMRNFDVKLTTYVGFWILKIYRLYRIQIFKLGSLLDLKKCILNAVMNASVELKSYEVIFYDAKFLQRAVKCHALSFRVRCRWRNFGAPIFKLYIKKSSSS